MHQRTARRTRIRWAAAAAGALLSVTVAAPAGAANTAAERLVDHDDNTATAPQRPFAGSDRFATAVLLAQEFVELAGSADTVLVASGETEVDAVAASGLAAALEAPIVLTRELRLPAVTTRFLVEHAPSRVLVLGGPAAVSDDVVDRIEALPGSPAVERIAGADRYETAAAIARHIGSTASHWCGTAGNTVVLAGGHAIAEAVAAGPLVYAHATPLLLTERDTLSEAAATWLTAADVDRVVIVGGIDTVSARIEEHDLYVAGVGDVRRIGSADAAYTSVQLVRELTGTQCAAAFASDTDTVGLVRMTSPSDGISAAPVFGFGLDTTPVGILLVNDELPAAARDYLASTPRYDASNTPIHLDVVAVGGTAAVSAQVMAAAVEAAGAAAPLRAKISAPKAGDTSFTVTFTDAVDPDRVVSRALLTINGVPRGDISITVTRPRQITVTFTGDAELDAGDVITVLDGVQIGVGDDPRPLQGDSYVVPEEASAGRGPAPVPQVSITAVTGANQFAVLVTNSVLAAGSTLDADEIEVVTAGGDPIPIEPSLAAHHNELLQHRYAWAVTVTEPLPEGAVIRIGARAVTDESGRYHNGRKNHVVRDAPTLRVNRVYASDPTPVSEGSAFISATTASLDAEPIVHLRSLSEGDAAGAASTQWRVDTWYDEDGDAGTVRVAADPRHHVLSITIAPQVSIRDLVSAIAVAPQIRDRFDVAITSNAIARSQNEAITSVGATAGGTHAAARFVGGRSKVEAKVMFNTSVASLADGGATLLEALLASHRASGDATTCTAAGKRWDCFEASPGESTTADVAVRFVPATSFVDIWIESGSLERLPQMRDPVMIGSGIAQAWGDAAGNERYARIWSRGGDPSDEPISHVAWN